MYVHCCGHRLNLIVEAAGLDVPGYNIMMALLQEVYNVIGASPKRLEHFQDLKESIDNDQSLVVTSESDDDKSENEITLTRNACHRIQSLSQTRWCCRINAARRVWLYFREIMMTLAAVANDLGCTGKTQSTARGVATQVATFDFIFWLHTIIILLSKTDLLNQAVQKKKETMWEAINFVEATKRSLADMKSDGKC